MKHIKCILFSILIFLTPFASPAAPKCAYLFLAQHPFIDPGIGIVRDSDGNLQTRLKLSHNDVFAKSRFRRSAAKVLNSMFAWASHLFKFQKLSSVVQRLENDERDIAYKHKLAEAFELKLRFSKSQAEQQIPKTGPMVMIGPHMRAGIDGMTMGSLTTLFRERDDVLIVLTKRLEELQGIQDNAILIDDSGRPSANAYNKYQRERIVQHLKEGKAIVIFPSGEISTKKLSTPDSTYEKEYAYDAIWKSGLFQFAQAVPETKIVPVYIEGQLSDSFHKMKNFNPMIAGTKLPVEMGNQIGDDVTINIGQTVNASDVLKIAEDYAKDHEQNSTEDLTPARYDLKKMPISKSHTIRVNNSFLSYLRSEVYELRKQSQEDYETHSPSEWVDLLAE